MSLAMRNTAVMNSYRLISAATLRIVDGKSEPRQGTFSTPLFV
jgi:hypothetical protein